MKVLLAGGGTGGHITPILAVARELKRVRPATKTVYVGEYKGKFAAMTANNPHLDQSYTVRAGKYRRYHGESVWRRLTDIKTNLLNFRDFFYFLAGTVQAIRLLRRVRPNVIVLTGGFVCVPVGLAAACVRIPFVTHDADAIPGLANRMVGRWAARHATAMPPEFYRYDKASVAYVGPLAAADFTYVTPELQADYKRQLKIPVDHSVVVVTGGSSGAESINKAVRSIIEKLFDAYPRLTVVHQVGYGKRAVYDGYTHSRLRVEELLQPMFLHLGASDVTVTRASANTVSELGISGKAAIVIPSPYLSGGHQLKNAAYLAEHHAALVIQESQTTGEELLAALRLLLDQPAQRRELGETLHAMTRQGAARSLAVLLLELADGPRSPKA